MAKRFLLFCAGIFLVITGGIVSVFLYGVLFLRGLGIAPGELIQTIQHPGAGLISSDSRTNILILGISGGNHEGNLLTDSITLLSLGRSASTSAILSVPRDLWSSTLQDKVNSSYYYGELSEPGSGLQFSRGVIGNILGIPIHYALTIDFSLFSEMIDALGGIDVHVGSSFRDEWYPVAGKENDLCSGDPTYKCRYKTVSFTKGLRHMDGDMALTYVRSRHAQGEDGTDFSRGTRQQEVIEACVTKLKRPFSWITLLRSGKLHTIASSFLQGDMTGIDLVTAALRVSGMHMADIQKVAIDDLLVNSEDVQGRYILIQKTSTTQFQKDVHQRVFGR